MYTETCPVCGTEKEFDKDELLAALRGDHPHNHILTDCGCCDCEKCVLEPEMTYHIRRRMRKLRGNQWYKDRGERKVATSCGADVTAHDAEWNRKAETFTLELYGKAVIYIPCTDCVGIREEAKQNGTHGRRLS